jgi:hypothetical protein
MTTRLFYQTKRPVHFYPQLNADLDALAGNPAILPAGTMVSVVKRSKNRVLLHTQAAPDHDVGWAWVDRADVE